MDCYLISMATLLSLVNWLQQSHVYLLLVWWDFNALSCPIHSFTPYEMCPSVDYLFCMSCQILKCWSWASLPRIVSLGKAAISPSRISFASMSPFLAFLHGGRQERYYSHRICHWSYWFWVGVGGLSSSVSYCWPTYSAEWGMSRQMRQEPLRYSNACQPEVLSEGLVSYTGEISSCLHSCRSPRRTFSS